MQMLKRVIFLGLLAALSLAGCSLFAGGSAAPSSFSSVALQSSPAPSAEPALDTSSGGQVGFANLGDVLFVRDGQFWVVGIDGSGEQALTALPEGSSPRSLLLSPSGQYVAFVLTSQQVMVLDLTLGQTSTIVEAPSGSLSSLGPLAWSAGGDALVYHQATFDAEGLLATDGLWQASMPPGTPPVSLFEVNVAEDRAVYYPGFAFGPDLLAVNRVVANSDDQGSWLLLTPSSAATVALADGYGLWDISPDRTKALLFSQADAMYPVLSLQLGVIPQPPGAITDIVGISPMDVQASFRSARFAPDGIRVVAMQVTATDQGDLGQAVLLQPDASGVYQTIALAPQPGANDMALAWHGEEGVVVQRWLSGEAAPSLWLLPLDGSPGRMLTSGEMPLVVGSR